MIEIEKIREILSSHGYVYEKYLGKGAFSSVMLCKSNKYNHSFAIKRAVKNKLTVSEYDTLISLIHPNIIRLYDSFEDDEAQFLVMEYCSNGTIFQKSPLPYDKFVYYAKQILDALSYCHSKKIAHRDIKPENIFIDQYDHVKLADFGFSKQFERKTTEKCGSLMFLAPEMLQNREICPFKADIWALGLTFFVMATGSLPFVCNNREDFKKMIFFGELDFSKYQVDQRIQYLIKKMTALNLANRPTTEKILKLPMFSSTSALNNIMLTEKFRKHSFSNGYRTPFTISNPTSPNLLEKNQFGSGGEEDPSKMPLSNILSYREINMYPQVQRGNRRYQPLKPL